MKRNRVWHIGLAVLLGLAAAASAQNTTAPRRPVNGRTEPGRSATGTPGSRPPAKSAPLVAPDTRSPLAARAELRLQPASRRVLALYFNWYGTPQKSGHWSHQDHIDTAQHSIGSHAHYPVNGPYDSTDPGVIERHLAQAADCGIDTLVCSWWGRQDLSDKALRALLPLAPAHNLSVCVLWDRLSGSQTADSALQELDYLLSSFGKSPAYLLEQGQPVVFVGGAVCRALGAEEWALVMEKAARRFPPGVRFIGTGDSRTDALLWDGLWDAGPIGPMTEKSPTVSARIQHDAYYPSILLAHALGRISVVTLLPGLDDRKPRATAGLKGGTVMERENGLLYRKLWEQALRDAPDWVLINSFNQWHAGTEIEPSVELGDLYLNLTHEQAGLFHHPVARQAIGGRQ